jgi:hypothetical protein
MEQRDGRGRRDYAPAVRPRSARQEGQRRLTPGYLEDLSDTKFTFFSDPSGTVARQDLLVPSAGRRLRVVRVSVQQIAADGLHYAELYFGDGATIAVNPERVVDLLRVPDLGEGATRSWARGAGPVGERDEPLLLRWTVAPSTSHKVIVEYTEER